MRSRAEWTLRAVAIAALLLLAWRAATPEERAASVVAARGALDQPMRQATRSAVAAMDVELDSVPGPVHRDWLRAIRGAGTSLTWRAPDVIPLAIAVAPVAEPQRRVRVVLASTDTTRAVLSDDAGHIDTARVRGLTYSRVFRTATGVVTAGNAQMRAMSPVPHPLEVRRVLVLGTAGWEAKFVVAALEEAGWQVHARIQVAPGVETRQGGLSALDTARYSAVVALDGAAVAHAGAIRRFVDAGGGAVLAGGATRVAALEQMTPAVTGTQRTTGRRAGLALVAVKADAAVLDAQSTVPLLVARRSGRGRVLATGYDETWRWRMARGDDAGTMHREWWTALVTAVAYAPPTTTSAASTAVARDPAPFAALHAALGPSSARPPALAAERRWSPPAWLLFGLLVGALLGEVFSRRLRGLA